MRVVVDRMATRRPPRTPRRLLELAVAEVSAAERLADRALLGRLPSRLGERHGGLAEAAVLEQLDTPSVQGVEVRRARLLRHAGKCLGELRPAADAACASASTRSRIASATSRLAARARHGARRRARRSPTSLSSESKPMSDARNVVEDDRVESLALELLAGAARSPRRRARPRSRPAVCSSRAQRARRPRARPRCAPGRARSAAGPRGAIFPASASRGAEVGHRGRHQQHVAALELLSTAAASSAVVSTSIRRDAGRLGQRRRWRRPGSPRAPRRAACSASARPMRPLERLPMKRTESIGSRVPPARHQHPQPVPRPARRAGSSASTSASSRSGEGSRPTPYSPREASAPSSGSITRMPRSRSVARFAWVAASRVHPVVHRRGDGARSRAGQERRA